MTNSIDFAKKHVYAIWQQTSQMATKVVEKVDSETLAKVGRVAMPILAVLLVLYLIHLVLKSRNIDLNATILEQGNAIIEKLKKLRKKGPILPLYEKKAFTNVQRQPKAPLGSPPIDNNTNHELMIHQGTSLLLKEQDRTLNVALLMNGLQLVAQFRQDTEDSKLLRPERVFVKAEGMIDSQLLLDIYNNIQLPNDMRLAPLNGTRVKLVAHNLTRLPTLEPALVAQNRDSQLLSSSIIPSKNLKDFGVAVVQKWMADSSNDVQRALFKFRPFNELPSRNEFDHKNAEILNQVMQFVFIAYWAKNESLQPKQLFNELKENLKRYDIAPIKRLFTIIENRASYTSNEQIRTEIHEQLCEIYKSDKYQHELNIIQKNASLYGDATLEGFANSFPLVYFAQTMARAFYLEVDLNDFEDRWMKKMLPAKKEIDLSNYAHWVSSHRTDLDTNAASLSSVAFNGIAAMTDFARIQSEKVVGSFKGMGFNPVHTNNCAQRLWVQNNANQQSVCIGIPVPTRDNNLGATGVFTGTATATMVEDLRLLLDNFVLTGQTFMSFMHLKIADKVSGAVSWEKGEENIRAKALFDVANSERYQGTYWYFSIPLDGYLFADPSKVNDPTLGEGKSLISSTNNHKHSYRVFDDSQLPGLYKFWMHAITNNRHGWFFMHDQIEKKYGEKLQQMYGLKTDQPVVPQICHNLFMEVHQFFFQSKEKLTAEEWQVFQVLLGVRIIETFSQFADVFHNTCKDAIDRAAVFLMARRYLNLLREGKNNDAQELWTAFVDYVKRAMAAKVQAPLEHRHHTAEATLKLLEKFDLKEKYKLYTQKKPETKYTMDRTTVTKRLDGGAAEDLMSSWHNF